MLSDHNESISTTADPLLILLVPRYAEWMERMCRKGTSGTCKLTRLFPEQIQCKRAKTARLESEPEISWW